MHQFKWSTSYLDSSLTKRTLAKVALRRYISARLTQSEWTGKTNPSTSQFCSMCPASVTTSKTCFSVGSMAFQAPRGCKFASCWLRSFRLPRSSSTSSFTGWAESTMKVNQNLSWRHSSDVGSCPSWPSLVAAPMSPGGRQAKKATWICFARSSASWLMLKKSSSVSVDSMILWTSR